MSQIVLDRYHNKSSAIHHLDARLKLLALLAFVLATTSLPPDAWPSFLALLILALGVAVASEIGLGRALRRSAIALPFALMVAVSLPFTRGGRPVWEATLLGHTLTVTDQGLWLFGSVVLKSWLSVLLSALLVATTPFADLLQALRALRIPSVLITTLSFTYRYLFVLVDEAMRLQTARAARSAGPGRTVFWRIKVLGGMIGSLFIRSVERSERIYNAMLSRGYAGQMRTLTAPRWQTRDTWAAVGWAAALAAIITAWGILP